VAPPQNPRGGTLKGGACYLNDAKVTKIAPQGDASAGASRVLRSRTARRPPWRKSHCDEGRCFRTPPDSVWYVRVGCDRGRPAQGGRPPESARAAADTFVDFEHGLNAAVKRLRDALGDSAEAPQFIETVPRRGYRFIAPVEVIGGPGDTVGTLRAGAVPEAGRTPDCVRFAIAGRQLAHMDCRFGGRVARADHERSWRPEPSDLRRGMAPGSISRGDSPATAISGSGTSGACAVRQGPRSVLPRLAERSSAVSRRLAPPCSIRQTRTRVRCCRSRSAADHLKHSSPA
jgi:hypothetical protein